MKFPISTGQAAQLLGTTEPRLAETVRRGRVTEQAVAFPDDATRSVHDA